MSGREFDVVLFGASGYAGALVAGHLAEAADPGVRIALAGRSSARLRAVRDRLAGPALAWPVIEVDAADAAGLRTLAARTAVLTTTVGPYLRHGRETVLAAAEEGTHYVDLTGEVLFVRWSLDEVAGRARETGARIVHSCGFDSIPSDLGVHLTAERAACDGEGMLAQATLVVRSLAGGVSGGTVDSLRQQVIAAGKDPEARRILRDPGSLSPNRSEEPGQLPPHCARPIARDPESGRWWGPFVMASYNTRVVRLSNALTGWSYGRALHYQEVMDVGAGPAAPARAAGIALGLGAVARGLAWTPTRLLLDRFLPRPGDGPSAAARAAGHFRMEIAATTTTGARYRTAVAAPYDPGYGGTAIMIGQSALCLAQDGPRLPERSGVLTPATAMGGVLAERLRARGFTFAVERMP